LIAKYQEYKGIDSGFYFNVIAILIDTNMQDAMWMSIICNVRFGIV
jgi:hypothetical protein